MGYEGFGDDLIQALGEVLAHAKGEGPAVVHEAIAPREVREAARLTQAQMAPLMGMSRSGYRKWEQGQRRVSGPAAALLRVIQKEPGGGEAGVGVRGLAEQMKSIVRRACLPVVWIAMSVEGASAESIRSPSPVIVFGDDAKDWKKELDNFADLVAPEKRPLIVAGDELLAITDDAVLVWFGDLEHSKGEMGRLPSALEDEVNKVGQEVADHASELPKGEVKPGVNCFVHHIDPMPGHPGIAVNFSGDDPQRFCIGLTIAHLLREQTQ